MKIYREYNKYDEISRLQGILYNLQEEIEIEEDPEKRLYIRAQIKNVKRQIRQVS